MKPYAAYIRVHSISRRTDWASDSTGCANLRVEAIGLVNAGWIHVYSKHEWDLLVTEHLLDKRIAHTKKQHD